MHVGTTIDYQIRLHGIPIGWKSLISAWEPPFRFVDEQVRGPYKFWHHEHTFEVRDGGTLIRDDVHYGVPGGWLAHTLLVCRDLAAIFQYRAEKMQAQFGGHEVSSPAECLAR
jgi:ligand-binding SRPBCC domain-containing protein